MHYLTKKKYFSNAAFDSDSFNECKQSALEMAEWKDYRLKEYLKRKKEKLNEGVKSFLKKGEADTALLYQTQIVLLNEIINEVFEEIE